MWWRKADPVPAERLDVPTVYMAQRVVRNQYGAPIPSYDQMALSGSGYEFRRAI